jgi:geranylgeranyl pyrophosphate synthase
MGTTLTEEEDRQLESVRKPCYTALSLANDYFSFDREYDEFQASSKSQSMTNFVWIHMKLHNVDVVTAKKMVKQAIWRYERRYLDLCAEYRREHISLSDHVDRYLRALAYQVSGNVVWSLNCPRYHPDRRYDPNAGLESSLTDKTYCQSTNLDLTYSNTYSAGNTCVYGAVATTLQHQRRESAGTTTTTGTNDDTIFEDISSQNSSRSACSNDHDLNQHCARDEASLPLLDDRHVRAPFEYIISLPSKSVRDAFIDALNVWLTVSESTVSRIKSLGGRLYSASLMLDDIEDGSSLRRSQLATHKVFGIAQTINSGCREILKAVNEASQLGVPSAIDITLEALDELHVGQSYDLYWTRHNNCPSKKEYLEMVDRKTGGLFRLLARLMIAASPHRHDTKLSSSIEALVSLVGVQFQIHDDYQNLRSAGYNHHKGFCEDLDEGKYSFPIIHALSSERQAQILRELLCLRRTPEGLSHEHKVLILERLEQAGSFQYTTDVLKQIQGRVDVQLTRLEHITGLDNWILRALLQRLEV